MESYKQTIYILAEQHKPATWSSKPQFENFRLERYDQLLPLRLIKRS